MPPSLALLLPTRELTMRDQRPDPRPVLALAEAADRLGFDSVWVGDSILARPRLEALTTLAAVAARTSRVRVGTAVLLSALRQPVVLANELASLDLIAGGRLILGLGIAELNEVNRREFEAVGMPFDRRISLFEEGLDVMRRLWQEEEVTFHGRHFRLEGVRPGLRPRQAPLPVWLAGRTPATFQRVLRLAEGWFPLLPSPEAFAEAWAGLQEAAADAGTDVSELQRAVYVTVNIAADVTRAEADLRAYFEDYYNARYEDLMGIHAARGGPPERCAAWLNDFLAAGAQTLVVRFIGEDQEAQLQRFTEEVAPLLA